jgi:hypothetical protein
VEHEDAKEVAIVVVGAGVGVGVGVGVDVGVDEAVAVVVAVVIASEHFRQAQKGLILKK